MATALHGFMGPTFHDIFDRESLADNRCMDYSNASPLGP